MPQFHHTLMGIGPLCDHGYRILFEETAVTVFSKDNAVLLTGFQEQAGAKLWRFSLLPEHTVLQQRPPGPVALNANNLPSVGTLVRYLHTAVGFPVKPT